MKNVYVILLVVMIGFVIADLVGLRTTIAALEARVTELEDWKAAEEEGDLEEDVAEDFGP